MSQILLVLPAGVGAGAPTAVGGRATFVALPAPVASGLSPVTADALSRIAPVPGAVAGAWVYRREPAPVGATSTKALTAVGVGGGGVGAGPLPVLPASSSDAAAPWPSALATGGCRLRAPSLHGPEQHAARPRRRGTRLLRGVVLATDGCRLRAPSLHGPEQHAARPRRRGARLLRGVVLAAPVVMTVLSFLRGRPGGRTATIPFPRAPEPGPTGVTEGGTRMTGPYTDAARARLVMAYEACELADLARAAVPVGEHELNPDGTTRAPGTVLADAARVLAAAQRFFEAAAVFERVGGAGWQLVADVLDVSAYTARVRFAMAEAAFRDALPGPGGTSSGATAGEVGRLRTYIAREPLETALDLDDWVRRHEDGDSDLGPAPVSGGLLPKDVRHRTEGHP